MLFNNSQTKNDDISFNISLNLTSNNKRKEYLFGSDKIIIEVINNKLSITVNHISELNSQILQYQREFSQEEINKLNKIFTIFDIVDDSINLIDLSLKENYKNVLISTNSNYCMISIKLNISDLPKTNISDIVIFNLPLILSTNNVINKNINQNNNNLNEINHNNNISIEDSNNLNLLSIIKKLFLKIEQLSEENKEIKNRINVLEKNNNDLIKIIKQNRIKYLEDKNTLNNVIIFNKKNDFINNNDNYFNILSSPKDSFNLNDSQDLEKSPNYLVRLHAKHQKEKEKNKNKLIFNDNEKDDEENYLYTNKTEDDIIDDIEFFKNNGRKSNLSCKKIYNNKYFEDKNEIRKNIMCVDENEEEKKEKFNNNYFNKIEVDKYFSKNKSSNELGAVFDISSFNLKNKTKLNDNSIEDELNIKRSDKFKNCFYKGNSDII